MALGLVSWMSILLSVPDNSECSSATTVPIEAYLKTDLPSVQDIERLFIEQNKKSLW